ncbi:hypothetical protein Tco_1419183 [Tanacetum coccineum]
MEEKYQAASQRIKSICNDEDDFIPLRDIIARYSPSVAITSSPPILPTKEPEDSLILGATEHVTLFLKDDFTLAKTRGSLSNEDVSDGQFQTYFRTLFFDDGGNHFSKDARYGVVTNKVLGDFSEHDVLMIPQDHEDPCLFSILQSSGLRSFAYFGILNPDHVQMIENGAKTGIYRFRRDQELPNIQNLRPLSLKSKFPIIQWKRAREKRRPSGAFGFY